MFIYLYGKQPRRTIKKKERRNTGLISAGIFFPVSIHIKGVNITFPRAVITDLIYASVSKYKYITCNCNCLKYL